MLYKNQTVRVVKQAFEYIGVFGIFAIANMALLASLIVSGS